MGERAYIVTQSIKKLKKEEKEWALSPQGFKRVSDNKPVDISKLPEDDKGLYYKDEPYTTKKLQQRLIITYSPKYALYQKSIRSKQIERAQAMLEAKSPQHSKQIRGDTAMYNVHCRYPLRFIQPLFTIFYFILTFLTFDHSLNVFELSSEVRFHACKPI